MTFGAGLRAARAQHTLGVYGGYGTASARFYPAQETRMVFGRYNFGLSWRYYSLPRFVGAVGADLELLQRGFSYGYTYTTTTNEDGEEEREYSFYTRRFNSIMLPLVWQPHVYMARNHVRLYLEAAVTFSYNFSGDYAYEDTGATATTACVRSATTASGTDLRAAAASPSSSAATSWVSGRATTSATRTSCAT